MQYYQQAKNVEYLITCYFKLENYDALKELIKELPEGSKHLIRIGDLLQRVGLHRSAVEAFIKCDDVKAAVDCCVRVFVLSTYEKTKKKPSNPSNNTGTVE